MAKIELCSLKPSDDDYTALGTELICLLLAMIAELAVLSYVMYQTCIGLPKQGLPIDKKLCLILQLYHIITTIFIFINLYVLLDAIFNNTDLSSDFHCYSDIFLVIPAPMTLSLFIIFWHERLKVVFADSYYYVSNKENIITISIVSILFFPAEIILSLSLIESIITTNKNNVFCLKHNKIIDFFPSITKQNGLIFRNHNSLYNNFYECEATTPTINIGTYVAAVAQPLLNIFISYQYLSRMYKLLHHSQAPTFSPPDSPSASGSTFSLKFNSASSRTSRTSISKRAIYNISRDNRDLILRSVFVSLLSTCSTIISISLYAVNANFKSLVFFDAVLNGILMISIFNFGKWIFDDIFGKCCGCYKCCCKWGNHEDNNNNASKTRVVSLRPLTPNSNTRTQSSE